MNRAEHRRKERNIKKKTGLSMDDIREMKEEATDKAFNKVFGCLFTLPLVILNQEYGFGKKRLQRFNDKLTDMLKEVEQGETDLTEMVKNMREEYGIIFRNGESD